MLITDPPYNVSYTEKEKSLIEFRPNKRVETGELVGIENDTMDDGMFEDFLLQAFRNAFIHMRPGAVYYCWHATSSQRIFESALERVGAAPRQTIIWVKNHFVFGRQDYQWRHEPCFYGWKEGGAHYFIDVRSLTTVSDDLENLTKDELIDRIKDLCSITTTIYEDKPTRSEYHPTMKPLGLFKKQIRNSSREGENVLDIFGGSGTTLIACEDMHRRCFMMEYDPHYADVIIQRWEEKTGKVAVRL